MQEGAAPVQVKQYGPSDYFGERALLKSEPRAANVIAQSELKVATIDRDSFMRLLGPLDTILQKMGSHAPTSEQGQDFVKSAKARAYDLRR